MARSSDPSESSSLGRALAATVFLLAAGAGCCGLQRNLAPQTFDFEGMPIGSLPRNWSQATHGDGSTRWEVVRGDSEAGRVLAQLQSQNPNRHFNLAICQVVEAGDVALEVSLKAVSGKLDQGGGLVWRYRDPQNYYVVRYNPLEQNVVAYKVHDGVRTDLPLEGVGRTYGVKVSVSPTGWHRLGMTARGEEAVIFLDGSELFRVRDGTFVRAGRIGLWTKADAVTWFDSLTVRLPTSTP